MQNKLFVLLFIGLMFVSLGSAQQETLGTFKQGETISLLQVCDVCTYVNITEITRKGENSTILLAEEVSMTKRGNNYNYSFSDTDIAGEYSYTTCGDKDGARTCEPVSLLITTSGKSGTDNIVFMVLLIIMIYGITLLGFFGKNIPITILGGMAMMFLGVYIIQQGLIIYRDALTNYFSYITMFTGAIMAFWAILEQFEVI